MNMTSRVTIVAHCGNTKAVHVRVREGHDIVEEHLVRDGQTKELYIYDSRVVTASEELLAATEAPARE